MKKFLKEMLFDTFSEGNLIGYIFGILAWISTITITVGFILITVWLIDSSFLPLKQKEGVVVKHCHIPAYTTTSYIMNEGILTPITSYIDDSFEITIEIDGLTDNVCLVKDTWSTIKVGDKFCFKYTKGRICKTLYIKSFCAVQK